MGIRATRVDIGKWSGTPLNRKKNLMKWVPCMNETASIKKTSMNPQGFMISISALFYPNSRVLGHLASREMFDEFQPNMRFNYGKCHAWPTKSKARCHHWRLREAFHYQVQAFRQERVENSVCFCWLEDCLLKCIVGVWKKHPGEGGAGWEKLKKMQQTDLSQIFGAL